MKFVQLIIVYMLSTGFCIGLDIVWLKTMKNFYFNHLSHLAKINNGALDVQAPLAIIVWCLMTLGIACFVIPPIPLLPTLSDAFWGALFGIIIYAVYGFTNAATLKDWPLFMVLVDSTWGAILCASTAYFMRFLYALLL